MNRSDDGELSSEQLKRARNIERRLFPRLAKLWRDREVLKPDDCREVERMFDELHCILFPTIVHDEIPIESLNQHDEVLDQITRLENSLTSAKANDVRAKTYHDRDSAILEIYDELRGEPEYKGAKMKLYRDTAIKFNVHDGLVKRYDEITPKTVEHVILKAEKNQ